MAEQHRAERDSQEKYTGAQKRQPAKMTMIEGPYTLLKSSDLDRIRNTLQEAPQTSNVLDVSKPHLLSSCKRQRHASRQTMEVL